MIEFLVFMVIAISVMIALYLIFERGSSTFFIPLLILPMIFIFSLFLVNGDYLAVDINEVDSLYSEDDIFRVMISTDDKHRNVIIEYVDVSWDWLSDNDFIGDSGELNRNSFFWEQVVRDAGVNNVNEVFVNLEVR